MPTPEQTRLIWHKSSYSNGDDGNCVEVATMPETMAVRDSKNRQAGHLDLPAVAWRALLNTLAG